MALLSRVLLGLALEYEAESGLSLAVGANLLRVLGPEGTRLRDLPLLTGISKEAVNWALGVLLRARLAVEEPDPAASRGKAARLTPAGRRAQRLYLELLGTVEDRWPQRFGGGTIGALRGSLEALAMRAEGQPPPLFEALEPYPDNWRASVRPPGTAITVAGISLPSEAVLISGFLVLLVALFLPDPASAPARPCSARLWALPLTPFAPSGRHVPPSN